MGELMRHSLILLAAASATALIVSGCARNEAAEPKAAPLPQVSVAPVISRKVTESDEFTGRFEAVERVEIRPRVSGYISSVNFTEGSEVKKGDVLFVIDPRPYEAERDKARAGLAQAHSQLVLAKSERERAQANVEAAQAALDAAALNVTFTRLTAPIAGRISRALVTSGNFVTNGQTPLTTLVSLDPIYVSFDGDEREYQKYTKLARDTAHGGSREARNPVLVGLADENGYPHPGAIVFVDNALDPATGTIRNRALLDNRDRVFTPGLFARIRLMGSGQHEAILINDSAIGTDQTVRYVLVVGAGNKVEYRPVQLGPVIDGLRVVQSGLAPGEIIVVNGLQRVRPGAQVAPQRVAMGTRRPGEDAALLASNTTDPAAGSAAP